MTCCNWNRTYARFSELKILKLTVEKLSGKVTLFNRAPTSSWTASRILEDKGILLTSSQLEKNDKRKEETFSESYGQSVE
jgi:hypothetical protein